MDSTALKIIYAALLNTAKGAGNWVKVYEGAINNTVAKAYYDSNVFNIEDAYINYINTQTIIIPKKGNPVFFYNSDGEKFFQFNSIKETESYFLFVLIKMIQKDWKVVELESQVSELKDTLRIYQDDDTMMYKVLYEESLDRIRALEIKLENKSKAYDSLNAQHEALLEKCNWDV